MTKPEDRFYPKRQMHNDHRRLRPRHLSDIHEIRRAYRELGRRSWPRSDSGGTTGRLASSHLAYEILSDPDRQGTQHRDGHLTAWPEQAFSDEVDIDFPAVSSLVERMRRSFFGTARQHLLLAEVRLTRTQATAGVRVPLDVSLRHSCPICGGRGEIWPDLCGVCRGSGTGSLPHQLELIVPPGVQHGTRLGFDVTPPSAPSAFVQVRISVE